MRFWVASLLCLWGVASFAATPTVEPITCNFWKSDSQFHVKTKVGNTPIVRAYFYEGTNTWNATGWTAIFKYCENSSASSAASVTGTVYGTYADFAFQTNDLPFPVQDWYAEVLVTTGTLAVSQCDGMITIDKSPSVKSSGALTRTTAINGPSYSFTGSFSGWPFLTTSSAVSTSDTSYLAFFTNAISAGGLLSVTINGRSFTYTLNTNTITGLFSASGGLLTYSGGVYGLTTAAVQSVVMAYGYATGAQLSSATNALDVLTIARDYPRSNPSNYVTASVTNGLVGEWVTNTLSAQVGVLTTNVYTKAAADAAFATAAQGVSATNAQARVGIAETNFYDKATSDGRYATAAQGIAGTNAQARADALETLISFTNSITLRDGVLNGSNGVYFVRGGTNYWWTFP